ncbi:uncharacterized protein [Drosophila tropicalis]|uniref:uncharacterized protein n=1 Tax=Drosophila tropicalis TaxID=46794 RepID=UPI0035AB8912
MAFRVGRIAVCADIAEMFHQINIQESDMQVQRFLWLNKNENTPRIFVMRAMTFGIICAPCIAHYVCDKNAENFQIKNPRAYESITKAHYVDDLIDSFKDDLEAITVTSSVRDIHADDGGSSVTLIDESILDKLKISSTPEPICLQWTCEETRNEENSVKTHLQISEAELTKSYGSTTSTQ